MKNQYVGDRRDLRKYDLWLHLADCIGVEATLTLIPMLTPDDQSSEGSVRSRPRLKRREIGTFFETLDHAQRNIRCVESLIAPWGRRLDFHAPKTFFDSASRPTYFSSVPGSWLRNTVVLVDPDIGLERNNSGYMRRRGEFKYLLFSELQLIATRMNESAILVIYQHLQRHAQRAKEDLPALAQRVALLAPYNSCAYIVDHDVAFLAIATHADLYAKMSACLREYVSHCALDLYNEWGVGGRGIVESGRTIL
jgi:hypothetical protein